MFVALKQIGGGDPAAGAGVPVHGQVRRGVPRQLDARRQDHQARHQGGAGVLRRRQLGSLLWERVALPDTGLLRRPTNLVRTSNSV